MVDILEFKPEIDSGEYKVYIVKTGWRDLADCIVSDYDLVLSNSPEIILPTLIHKYLRLPWTTSDHGYWEHPTPGFEVTKLDLSSDDSKFSNKYRDLEDHLEPYQNGNYTSIQSIHTLIYDIESSGANEEYAKHEVIEFSFEILDELIKAEDDEISKRKKEARQKQADAKFNQLVDDISQLSIANKQKILAKLVK